MDSSAITDPFGVRLRQSQKSPLSVGHISVYHDSYTISAKCSTRMNNEWKVKESCLTKTVSYTINKPADAKGCGKVRKMGLRRGAARQHGIEGSIKSARNDKERLDAYVQVLSAI